MFARISISFTYKRKKERKLQHRFKRDACAAKQPTFKPLLLLVQVARSKTKVYLYIARFQLGWWRVGMQTSGLRVRSPAAFGVTNVGEESIAHTFNYLQAGKVIRGPSMRRHSQRLLLCDVNVSNQSDFPLGLFSSLFESAPANFVRYCSPFIRKLTVQ